MSATVTIKVDLERLQEQYAYLIHVATTTQAEEDAVSGLINMVEAIKDQAEGF